MEAQRSGILRGPFRGFRPNMVVSPIHGDLNSRHRVILWARSHGGDQSPALGCYLDAEKEQIRGRSLGTVSPDHRLPGYAPITVFRKIWSVAIELKCQVVSYCSPSRDCQTVSRVNGFIRLDPRTRTRTAFDTLSTVPATGPNRKLEQAV